jgi:hypothetical protein
MQTLGDYLPTWLLGFPFLVATSDRMMIGGPRSPLKSLDFDDRRRVPGVTPASTPLQRRAAFWRGVGGLAKRPVTPHRA